MARSQDAALDSNKRANLVDFFGRVSYTVSRGVHPPWDIRNTFQEDA